MQNANKRELYKLSKSPKFYDVPMVTPQASPERVMPDTPVASKPDPIVRSAPLKAARSWVELFQDEIDAKSDDYKLALEHARSPS